MRARRAQRRWTIQSRCHVKNATEYNIPSRDIRKGLYRIDLSDVLFEHTGESEMNPAPATRAARQRSLLLVSRLLRPLLET
jgi:hypothetical protein